MKISRHAIKLANVLATFSAICLLPVQVNANEVEAAISDAMVDFRFTSDFDQDFMGRFAVMYSEDEEAKGDEEVENKLLSYTFGSRGQRENFDISLGGRLYFMDIDVDGGQDGSGVGLALGFGVSAEVLPKLSVGVEAFYSPDILTGGDLDSTSDIELRLSYQLIENGSVFVGYRNLRAEFDDGEDGDVYDGGLIGMRLTF